MKKLIITASMLAAAILGASAAESPLWLRNTAISPDGSQVAFTYKGNVYTVPVTGGSARRLTATQGFNTAPVWSPDGRTLAFASDREGSLDLYVMPATGGTPRRVTTHSGKETPLAFLNDSTLLYSTSVMPARGAAQAAFQSQVWQVNVHRPGARPTLFSTIPAQALSVAPDGSILYQDRKGYEDPLRKHERSSGTADVWLLHDGHYTRLTTFNGQDQNPVWGRNGKFYYTSERADNTLNVFASNVADTAATTQLTHFAHHPVRSLSAAADGTLAFSWNGEIYTLRPGATEPSKLNVEIVTDDYTRTLVKTTRRSGARSMAVSPDGDEVAFVVHGDVYVTSTKYGTTRRITSTPEQERTVDFSADGRTLVYDGERDGIWQLYTATITNPDEKKFTYATEITETPLYRSDKPSFQPQFSPDGKEVAFLEDRTELRVINLKDKKVRTALPGKYNYSYTDGDISFQWSPDSRWLLADYIGIGGWNNPDIALVKADGSEVHDLTQSGYSDKNAKWVLDGKAMVWSSDRYGMRSHGSWGSQDDAFIMFFDGEAFDRFLMNEEELTLLEAKEKEAVDKEAEKKDDKKDKKDKKKDDKKEAADEVKPLEFDLDNARYRVRRLSGHSSALGDFALSKKGDKLFYVTSFEGNGDLWMTDLKKGDTKILAKGVGYGSLEYPAKGDGLFMLGNGIKKINTESGSTDDVSFEARAEYLPFAEREYMFNHMWQQVKDKFYDANLHGVDWTMYGDAYRRFLPHITNNYDFAELLSEILGELNASHTGGRYYAPGASQAVANLGAFYDPAHTGDGLLVAEVIKRGPLDRKKASVRPGDLIMAINGRPITADTDYYPLMEGLDGRNTLITVKRADSGKTEKIQVKPISQGALSDLLYQRWVERNQAVVDSVSGGRLAYVHIEGMNSPSYRRVFSELLGKYRNKEAVIVDTRYNGGGWLHNDIALLLGGREYVRFAPRGQYIGSEPFTQWTKPSAMLINESNYSDAHGTPYTYKTLGLGSLVGAPVPGTMTAVWWENQMDPSIIFGIPQVTSLDVNGHVLENQQLNPDVEIYNTPEQVIAGHDAQLIGAARHLLQQLDSNKK